MTIQILQEVWRITERRNGAIYKTEYIEDRWETVGDQTTYPDQDPDLLFVPKSSSYEGPTMRKKPENGN